MEWVLVRPHDGRNPVGRGWRGSVVDVSWLVVCVGGCWRLGPAGMPTPKGCLERSKWRYSREAWRQVVGAWKDAAGFRKNGAHRAGRGVVSGGRGVSLEKRDASPMAGGMAGLSGCVR